MKDDCYTCLLLCAKVNSQCVQRKTYGPRFLLDNIRTKSFIPFDMQHSSFLLFKDSSEEVVILKHRKCLKDFAGYFILLHFILKLHFTLKLLKKWDLHYWKSNSCIKKKCFFFMTIQIFLGNINRCFESSARWPINSIKFHTILFYIWYPIFWQIENSNWRNLEACLNVW